MERGFVLNCVNQVESQLPEYDYGKDKYLKYFFIRTSTDHSNRKGSDFCSARKKTRYHRHTEQN
jgi:hypothetical protein